MMNCEKQITRSLLSAVTGLALAVQCLSAADPVRTVDMPRTAAISSPDGAQPHWDKGYLISLIKGHPGIAPRIWVNDSTGRAVIDGAEVWLPDARSVVVDGTVAAQDGSVWVSAQVWNSSPEMATVLLHMKGPGVIDQVIRTNTFSASHLLLDPGGLVWGIGANPLLNGKSGDYPLVEQFDSSVRLKVVLRKSDVLLASDANFVSFFESMIGSSSNSIGIYIPFLKVWKEYDFNGTLLQEFSVAIPEVPATQSRAGLPLIPWPVLAMTQSGRVYAKFGPPYELAGKEVVPAVGLYQLDRTSKKWVQVAGFKSPGYNGIFGVDGDAVIMRKDCCTYGWFTPTDVVTHN
jgi:hypothetical protein